MKKRELNIKIVSPAESRDDLEYWQSRTPAERFFAVEELRRCFYSVNGYDGIPKIRKVVTIRKRNAAPS